ncbi:MAG: hypothetical protein ACKVS6_15615 [Planctomycetota bacterium]
MASALPAILCLLLFISSAFPQASTTALSEQIDLARLVDLAAKRRKVNIEYDPQVIKGSATIRMEASLSDDELWNITNRLLASRGFAIIQGAGIETLSVVKIADAPAQARVEPESLQKARAGFVKIIQPLPSKSSKELLDSLQLMLSKPGGTLIERKLAGAFACCAAMGSFAFRGETRAANSMAAHETHFADVVNCPPPRHTPYCYSSDY